MTDRAWAVLQNGKINLNTVHDSERGAKVNGLVLLFGIMPLASWSDWFVDAQWNDRAPRVRAIVVEVKVTPA